MRVLGGEAAVVEINSETDFVARSIPFQVTSFTGLLILSANQPPKGSGPIAGVDKFCRGICSIVFCSGVTVSDSVFVRRLVYVPAIRVRVRSVIF